MGRPVSCGHQGKARTLYMRQQSTCSRVRVAGLESQFCTLFAE